MAINFPNSPIGGNTYDFLGVRYTYVDSGGGLGYWKVTTPGTVGIASSAEIDADVEPVKYITPLSFAGSKYATVFPPGTKMLFQQTNAPVGWTKQVTHNNKALRVVSGTVGSGGTVAFTTAFSSKAVAGTLSNTVAGGSIVVNNHTLTTSQMPSHVHAQNANMQNWDYGGAKTWAAAGPLNHGLATTNTSTAAEGGGGGHNHGGSFTGVTHGHTFSGTAINMAVQYVDLIIATKD